MNTEILLDKLTKAVSFRFKEDKTAPSVVISALKNGYYCSVVRYNGAFAKGKVVVCSAKDNTLDGALEELAKEFLTKITNALNPLQELESHLRYNK